MNDCTWRASCRRPASENTPAGAMCEPHAAEYYTDQLGGHARVQAVLFFARREIASAIGGAGLSVLGAEHGEDNAEAITALLERVTGRSSEGATISD